MLDCGHPDEYLIATDAGQVCDLCEAWRIIAAHVPDAVTFSGGVAVMTDELIAANLALQKWAGELARALAKVEGKGEA